MKANEFIKRVGWDLAKEYADECPNYCNYLHEHGFYKISETWQLNKKHVLVSDLKRLVESHELVESCGGINAARKELANFCGSLIDCVYLGQAIADVESCMEVSRESN